MHEYHTAAFNLCVAALIGTTPLWLTFLDESSAIATKILPLLGLIIAVLQLWFLVRKFFR
jgi:hypothetical protein